MALTIAIILALVLFVVMTYNGMIKLRNRVKEAWSDIDVQLKRRYNLIPNIVETVKGYATHEESVLTKVTEARSNAINATNVKDQGQAENMLSGALKSLFAVAESYPDLKANENFLQLQNELVDTEDKIQSSRRFYNGNVRDFNTKIQQFPASLIAGLFKFVSEEFFEIENEEEKENVKVDFNKGKTPAEEPKVEAPTETPAEEPTPETPKAEEPPVPNESEDTNPRPEEKPTEEHKVETTEEVKPAEEPTPETTEEVKPAEEPKVETPAPTPAEAEKSAETPDEEPTPETPKTEDAPVETEEEKKEE